MKKFEIEFYRKENGRCPIEEFLESLELKMRAKVLRTLLLLENNGNDLREPYSKMLEDGIFELRVKLGSDISRVLYFFTAGSKIVITNGFIKKTQKTDRSQIKLAKRYRVDYLKRMGKSNE